MLDTTVFLFLGPNIWGEWEAWSGCDVTCGEGERMRSRECLSSTLPCVGTNVSYDICPAEVVCPGTVRVVRLHVLKFC